MFDDVESWLSQHVFISPSQWCHQSCRLFIPFFLACFVWWHHWCLIMSTILNSFFLYGDIIWSFCLQFCSWPAYTFSWRRAICEIIVHIQSNQNRPLFMDFMISFMMVQLQTPEFVTFAVGLCMIRVADVRASHFSMHWKHKHLRMNFNDNVALSWMMILRFAFSRLPRVLLELLITTTPSSHNRGKLLFHMHLKHRYYLRLFCYSL